MPYCTQKVALLLKLSHDSHCFGVIELKEGGVEDFGSAREIITLGLVYSPIRASAQLFGFDELDSLVAERSLGLVSRSQTLARKGESGTLPIYDLFLRPPLVGWDKWR